MKQKLIFGALLLGGLLIFGCADPEKELLEEAAALFEAGDYAAAISAVEGLTESEAARSLLADCEAAMQREAYDRALGALEAGDYGVAQTAFLQLGDYADARERAEQARLLEAQAQAEALAERVPGRICRAEDPFGEIGRILQELTPLLELPPAASLHAALTALSQGDGAGLLACIGAEQPPYPGPEDYEAMLSACLTAALPQGDTALSLLAARQQLAAPAEGERGAIEILPAEGPLLHARAEQVLERVGKAPEGKILIYATRRHYASEDQAYYDLSRMAQLPADLLPDCPEQASYLIRIAYDYKRVNRFTTYYNRGVLEFADITLMDAVTGRKVGGTVEVRGPGAKSLETAKITSEFVSGGPPPEQEIDLAVTAAANRALALLSGEEQP